MGESTTLHAYDISHDLQLLSFVSSVNIACGFHAGDPLTMRSLAEAALAKGVAIGAHPAFPDREHFGRRNMKLTPREIRDIVLYQCGALQTILKSIGTSLHHVKPHGALYNMAANDILISTAICDAIADLDQSLMLYGLSGSCMKEAADAKGIHFVSEVFADRSYQHDGSLTPRTSDDALITDEQECREQLLDMVLRGRVFTRSREYISLKAGTICLHADGEHALAFAGLIKDILDKEKILIAAPSVV